MISKVIKYVRNGWPVEPVNLKDFECRKLELHIEGDCLMWGHRVVVPASLREMSLKELHVSHMGVVRMKALARSYVWWPGIDRDIEEVAKSCLLCLENSSKPARNPLTVWKWPGGPNHRIHADFAGPIDGSMFLIIVDAFSKWIDVRKMNDITTQSTISIFEDYFATWGIPIVLVTDNGTSFTSKDFEMFTKHCGFEHIRTPPYHPASNGAAENIVKTFKSKLKVLVKSGRSVGKALRIFLMSYRATPHCTTGFSPAELQMGRKLRIKLDLLRPNLRDRVIKQQTNQQYQAPGTHWRTFEIGQKVMASNHLGNNFVLATVEDKISPVVYLVRTEDNRQWKRHVDQLKACSVQLTQETTARDVPKLDQLVRPVLENNIGAPESATFSPEETTIQRTVAENRIPITVAEAPVLPTPGESSVSDLSRSAALNSPLTDNVPINVPVRRSTRMKRVPERLNL